MCTDCGVKVRLLFMDSVEDFFAKHSKLSGTVLIRKPYSQE